MTGQSPWTPRGYVVGEYLDYQKRYTENPRESDRVLVDLAVNAARSRQRPSILDIGCSTGNLLRHLRAALPTAQLTGIDVFEELAERNKADPELDGMAFVTADVLELPTSLHSDIVVVSAVLGRFDDDQFGRAIAGLGRVTVRGGTLLLFEWIHPHEQVLDVLERSVEHPTGLRLVMRPESHFLSHLEQAGFSAVEFRPFVMPFDLARPEQAEDLRTYTVPSADGTRMSFRGALYQPWCHVVARKP